MCRRCVGNGGGAAVWRYRNGPCSVHEESWQGDANKSNRTQAIQVPVTLSSTPSVAPQNWNNPSLAQPTPVGNTYRNIPVSVHNHCPDSAQHCRLRVQTTRILIDPNPCRIPDNTAFAGSPIYLYQ